MEIKPEVRQLCDEIRRFIRAEVDPRSRWIEENDEVPADLIEKASAALGFLKHPFLVGQRSGKGAAHMAEELTFQNRFGQRAAIHRDKRTVGPRTVLVNGSSN